MTTPRNVTPGIEDEPRPSEGGFGGGFGRGTRVGSSGGSGRSWEATWGGGGGSRGGVPFFGILLLVIGGVLLLQEVFPNLGLRTILVVGLGVALAVAMIATRSNFLLTPTFIFLGLGAGWLSEDLGYTPDSISSLTLGVALLLLWVIGQVTNRPRGWALWLGGILAVIGLVQVSGQIPGLPDLGRLWPLLLIVAGAVIIFGGRFGQGRREI